MKKKKIVIYTDGSCNTQNKIGAWAAILFIHGQKVTLLGTAQETTHNRMELMAVIKSIEYVLTEYPDHSYIQLFSDSQYVERIPKRTPQLISNNFKTKKGTPIQNIELIQKLISLQNSITIEFIKVKAHQKTSEIPNYNREVDKLSRKLVRSQLE